MAHDIICRVNDALRDGVLALRRGDLVSARRLLEQAVASEPSGVALENLAEALYLDSQYGPASEHYERASNAYLRDGDLYAAARTSRSVAWIAGSVLGEWENEEHWFTQTRSLLNEAGVPGRGWVLMFDAVVEPDAHIRESLLLEAAEEGRRRNDPNLEVLATVCLGAVLVLTNRAEAGFNLLDTALAAVVAGQVDELIAVDEIFCGLFFVCELAVDLQRASQWLRASEHQTRRSNVVAAFGHAHYGAVLTAAGRLAEAESELVEAVRRFDHGISHYRTTAAVRLANVRTRQARLDVVTDMFDGVAPQPAPPRPAIGPRRQRAMTPREQSTAPNGLRRLLLTVALTMLFVGALTLLAIYETQGNDPFRPEPGDGTSATIVTQNKVIVGPSGLIEDKTPLYLSRRPVARCAGPEQNCAVPGTFMGSGIALVATCFVTGEGMTNMDVRSSSARRNPHRVSSDLWYGTRAPDGSTAYLSEVYVTHASRGGLGLRWCQ